MALTQSLHEVAVNLLPGDEGFPGMKASQGTEDLPPSKVAHSRTWYISAGFGRMLRSFTWISLEHMASGFPRAGQERGERDTHTQKEREQGVTNFFNDRDLEVTHFPFYPILLVISEPLSKAHVQGKGILSWRREFSKICGHLFKLPLAAWIELRSVGSLSLEMNGVLR